MTVNRLSGYTARALLRASSASERAFAPSTPVFLHAMNRARTMVAWNSLVGRATSLTSVTGLRNRARLGVLTGTARHAASSRKIIIGPFAFDAINGALEDVAVGSVDISRTTGATEQRLGQRASAGLGTSTASQRASAEHTPVTDHAIDGALEDIARRNIVGYRTVLAAKLGLTQRAGTSHGTRAAGYRA